MLNTLFCLPLFSLPSFSVYSWHYFQTTVKGDWNIRHSVGWAFSMQWVSFVFICLPAAFLTLSNCINSICASVFCFVFLIQMSLKGNLDILKPHLEGKFPCFDSQSLWQLIQLFLAISKAWAQPRININGTFLIHFTLTLSINSLKTSEDQVN